MASALQVASPSILSFLSPPQGVIFLASGRSGQDFMQVLQLLEQFVGEGRIPLAFEQALQEFKSLQGSHFFIPGPMENPCKLTGLAVHNESDLTADFAIAFWNLPSEDIWPISAYLDLDDYPQQHDSWQSWLAEKNASSPSNKLVQLLDQAHYADLLWFPDGEGESVVTIFFKSAWFSGSMVFQEQFVDPAGLYVD